MTTPTSVTTPSRIARSIAVLGYVGVAASVLIWFEWLSPSQLFGHGITATLLVPLLFAAPGMLRGRPYTYAWASLLALPYLGYALSELTAAPHNALVASLMLYPATMWFVGSICFVRLQAREAERSKASER